MHLAHMVMAPLLHGGDVQEGSPVHGAYRVRVGVGACHGDMDKSDS